MAETFYDRVVRWTGEAYARLAEERMREQNKHREAFLASINIVQEKIAAAANKGWTHHTTFIIPDHQQWENEFVEHFRSQGFSVTSRPPVAEGSSSSYYEIEWDVR